MLLLPFKLLHMESQIFQIILLLLYNNNVDRQLVINRRDHFSFKDFDARKRGKQVFSPQ